MSAGPWEDYADDVAVAKPSAGGVGPKPWEEYAETPAPEALPVKAYPGTFEALAARGKTALEDAGHAALEGFGKVSNAVDSVTGAPVRAAAASFQRGDSLGDVLKAAKDQFLSDPAKAPTGKQLMEKAGLSAEEGYPVPLITNPWVKGDAKYAHVSPAGIAGAIADAVLDPTSYVGVGLAGDATKGAMKGAQLLDSRVASYLGKLAEERAAKAATGQNISALRKMANVTAAGSKDAERVMNKLRETGRQLLDEGTVGFGDRVQSIAPKATAALQQAGSDIGAVESAIDTARPKGSVSGDAISNEILNYASTIPETVGGQKLQERLLAEAQNIQAMGDMTFEKAKHVKDQFKYKPQDQDLLIGSQDVTNKLNGIIGSQMDRTAEQLSPEIGGGLAEQYSDAKRRYRINSGAAAAANDRVLKDLSNRFASPSDYGVGGAFGTMAAGITRDPAVTAAATAIGAGANKLIRERGSASAAAIANAISTLMQKNPERFAKWSPLLETAAQGGAASVAVRHHLLMNNDPEYRQAIYGATP